MRGSPSRGEARKRAIAEAALEVFLRRGFGEATIDEVAREASASKQTIYRFFGGRDGLIEAAFGIELARVIAPFDEAVSADGAADERLDRAAAAFQEVVFDERCLRIQRYVIGDATANPGLGSRFSEQLGGRLAAAVVPLVAEATGSVGPAAELRAELFIGALQGVELSRALAGERVDRDRLDALRRAALETLLDGAPG
ncbi:TetR/AcrR family transcriptional regulator [Agromyces sp. ZXT2-3]|uniref:TetR/AcrR family transcriptional regulator n=1 Tax=Agromyces sp. ZXT2-3 TaxID=3461152 RepID=UPI004054F085